MRKGGWTLQFLRRCCVHGYGQWFTFSATEHHHSLDKLTCLRREGEVYVCEQLVHSRYMRVELLAVESATYLL